MGEEEQKQAEVQRPVININLDHLNEEMNLARMLSERNRTIIMLTSELGNAHNKIKALEVELKKASATKGQHLKKRK